MKSVAEIFSSYEQLGEDGRHVNGTDKHGPNHQYGDAYEQILGFGSMRVSANLVMEIGIADGSSLLGWSEVFPYARCVGLDIHPIVETYNDRVEFVLGDQRSREDCERAAAGRMFDFICEDATHQIEDSLRTLLFLWPFVEPGGIYVVEEFANAGSLRSNIATLWPFAEIVDTVNRAGGTESLVVFRKPK